MTLLMLVMLTAAPKDCGTDLKCFRERAAECKPVVMHKPHGPAGPISFNGTLRLSVVGPAKNGCTFEIERKLVSAKADVEPTRIVGPGATVADLRKWEKQFVADKNAAPDSKVRCVQPVSSLAQTLARFDGVQGADFLGECLALVCPKRELASGCTLGACKDGVQQLTCGKGKDAPSCPVPRGISLCKVSGCDGAMATFNCSDALKTHPVDVLSEAGVRESTCVLEAAYKGDLATEKACAAPLEAVLKEQASQPRTEEIDATRIGVTATLVGARKLLEPELPAGAIWKSTGEALAADLADYEKYRPGLAQAVQLSIELYSGEVMRGAEVAPKARALAAAHPEEEAAWLLALGTSEMLNGEKGDPTTFPLEVPKNASDRLQVAQLHMLVSQTARYAVPKVAKRAAAELDRLAARLPDLEDELLRGDLAALDALESGKAEAWREAQKHYQVASESADDGISSRAFNNLGVVDIALGKPDAAKPLFEQAADRRPDEQAPRLNLSMRESVAAKKVQSAGDPVEGGLFSAWVFRAQVLAAKGDREGAKTAAVWALERLKQRKWRDGEIVPELGGSFTVNLTPHRNGFSLDFHGAPAVWLVNRPPVTKAELEALAK